MFYRLVILVTLLVFLSGCQYPFEFRSETEIREEVLEQDPSFGAILKHKAEMDEQIGELKSELNTKVNEIDSKVLTLKRELSSTRDQINTKIVELNQQLDPDRIELKQHLMELTSELKLRESSLSATNKMIARLNKLIKQSSLDENMADEVSKWQDKIGLLVQQARAFESDIISTREKIKLLRLKLKLIK